MFDNLNGFNIFIQAIGFVAVGFSTAVFQVNNRRKMLRLMMCAGLLYAVHFYLLGAVTGAAMNFIGVGRNYAFDKYKTPERTWLLPSLFIILFATAAVITWQGPISLLPFGGAISATIAVWQSKPKRIRRFALIANPLWFTYNLISGSFPGMIVEVAMLISNLIGMYRFDFRLNSVIKSRTQGSKS